MATTALEVVPLPAMRRELRIEQVDPDDDARLIGQIGAAVSDVSLDASAPLVEQDEIIECKDALGDTPLFFEATVVREIRRVRYWTPGARLGAPPDGVIEESALGRHQADWPTTRHNLLYPPTAGWPRLLAGSRVWVEVTRGVPFPEWVDWPGAPPAADASPADREAYAERYAAYVTPLTLAPSAVSISKSRTMAAAASLMRAWRNCGPSAPSLMP